MKIGIIGMGVVGTACKKMFEFIGHEVLGYDIKNSPNTFEEILTTDIIFICLPTPQGIDGSISMAAFDNIFPKLSNYKKLIVIKSTVLPGTCKEYAQKYNLSIAHNPEFLTEKNALLDSVTPSRIVIGADETYAQNLLLEIYKPFNCSKILCNTQTSEMSKYCCNNFLAMKVSYANEMFDICKKIGADWNKIWQVMELDNRIGGSHLTVTPERGYGGMCFPKDTNAFYKWSNSKLVKATIDINNEVRK